MGDNGSVGDRTTVVSGTGQLANVGDVLLAGQLQANWSSLTGGNGTREIIPSSINSSQTGSQGSISSTVVDNFANGSNGGSTTTNNTIVEVFPVPGFSGLMSGRFFDVSTGLVGMVGSLDAGARPLLVSPATGSFVFGPLVYASLGWDEEAKTVIRGHLEAQVMFTQLRMNNTLWEMIWPHTWTGWSQAIGTSPDQAVRNARLQVAKE
jgi:hypothetical protein